MKTFHRSASYFFILLAGVSIGFGAAQWQVRNVITNQIANIDEYARQRSEDTNFVRHAGVPGGAEDHALYQLRKKTGLYYDDAEALTSEILLGAAGLISLSIGIYLQARSKK